MFLWEQGYIFVYSHVFINPASLLPWALRRMSVWRYRQFQFI